jgi:hypothetical protein
VKNPIVEGGVTEHISMKEIYTEPIARVSWRRQ